MNDEKLQEILKQYGTPTYIFDTDIFEEKAKNVKTIFGQKTDICFSIKANPFLLKNLPDVFKYVEVCSPGELNICKNIKLSAEKIILSGVNKTYADVYDAILYGVRFFTAESILQIEYINKCASENFVKVDVILRLSNGSQFGMDENDLLGIIANKEKYSACNIIGLHYFTGTQKKSPEIILKELEYIENFSNMLKGKYNFFTSHIEYGSGFPTEYFDEDAENIDNIFLQKASSYIKEFSEKFHLCVEMGRFFAADCGVYLTSVKDVKRVKETNYAICDGGINQLGYYGQILGMKIPEMRALVKDNREKDYYTLCGSLCTTADVLVKKVILPKLCEGDVIEFFNTGAYSVSECMAVFLSRSMPRVILYNEKDGAIMVRDYFNTDKLNTP